MRWGGLPTWGVMATGEIQRLERSENADKGNTTTCMACICSTNSWWAKAASFDAEMCAPY